MKINQLATVLCITLISCMVVVIGPEYAKDILIGAVSGLIGYLSGEHTSK